jgi:hypothetical protein
MGSSIYMGSANPALPYWIWDGAGGYSRIPITLTAVAVNAASPGTVTGQETIWNSSTGQLQSTFNLPVNDQSLVIKPPPNNSYAIVTAHNTKGGGYLSLNIQVPVPLNMPVPG